MRVAQTNLCRISCMFLLLVSMTEVFPCFFLSYKANARVKLGKTGARPALFTIVICVVRLLFVLFYVLFVRKYVLPPGDNPIAVNKYIISLLDVLGLQNGVQTYVGSSMHADFVCNGGRFSLATGATGV